MRFFMGSAIRPKRLQIILQGFVFASDGQGCLLAESVPGNKTEARFSCHPVSPSCG
jgi:hypothetical protein